MNAINDFLKAFLIKNNDCQSVLDEVLKCEDKKGTLRKYSVEQALDLHGFFGNYIHLDIVYQKENATEATDKRLFLKTIPYRSNHLRQYAEKFGLLKKESGIYIKLLNEMKKLSPTVFCGRCYFAKPDLFVMDNMETLGYERLKDAKNYLEKLQIHAILKGLAAMHACSLGFERENNVRIGDFLHDILQEAYFISGVPWHAAGKKAVMSVLRTHQLFAPEAIQTFVNGHLTTLFNSVYKMVNPSAKYCNVFCHRELWAGNVLLPRAESKGTSAVFVDFQMSRYSPAAIDLLMVMHMFVKPSVRKLMQDEYCRYYYDQFTIELSRMKLNASDFITYDHLKRSLSEYAAFGYLYSAIAATILGLPVEHLKDMELNDDEDFYRFTSVDRTDVVLRFMKFDKAYNKYVLEHVKDMLHYMMHVYF